jgi:tetratricopeptide (TPR) repeat protein
MTSPLSPTLCPQCSGENSSDSRFCRHCGHTLETAKVEAISTPVEATNAETLSEPLSSPAEIDGRRAVQLLDRAQYLSERGDIGGAILACRQSIALAPAVAQGHSTLGHLLERSGDLAHAIAAFEKATLLAPDSPFERDNLERVTEKLQSQQSDTQFRFDDTELFADTNSPEVAASAPPAGVHAGDHSLNVIQSAPATTAARTVGANPVAPPLTPKAATPIVFERRVSQRRRFNTPITIERRSGVDRRVPVGAAQNLARPVVPTAPVAPIFQAPVTAPGGTWGNLWSRPSYFGRSLPLAGATVLALGLLSMARSGAVARAVDAQIRTASVVDTQMPAPPDAPIVNSATGLPPLAPVGGTQPDNGGLPISNRPAAAVPVAPAPPANASISDNTGAGNAARRPSTAPRASTSPRTGAAASRPVRSLQIPPAPIPPARVNSNSGRRNSDPLSLPAPNIPAPQPAAPPVTVLPSGSSPALNPAGASGRGYVRITQGRIGTSALPQRPSSQGNNDERGAAAASRNGQSEQAIDRLTSAINANASDAGYRYQQRAQLFLNRGDYSRAADDFQAAMSAYRAQIDRGEQVAAARAGYNSARSGLNLALAGGR